MKKSILSLAAVLLCSMAFAESYTLNFVENAADTTKDASNTYSKGDSAQEYITNIFGAEATQYVATIDTRDAIYAARKGCGAKFGTAANAKTPKTGFVSFTLATPTEVDSIIISAAWYGADEGKDGLQAINVALTDTATFALSAGNKVFENCVWKPAGVVTSIRINQKTLGQRIYVKSITIYPKKATDPTAIETATAVQDNRIYTILGTYMGTEWNALPAGVYIQNGKKISK